MTADKHTKRAARDLAAREGISYAAALRRLTATAAPVGRAREVVNLTGGNRVWHRDAEWFLALLYAMLTHEHAELRPDPDALRAAVEADDLAAIDALMDLLDRAAAQLLDHGYDGWWSTTRPRVDAYVATVEQEVPRNARDFDRLSRVNSLTRRWRPVRSGW